MFMPLSFSHGCARNLMSIVANTRLPCPSPPLNTTCSLSGHILRTHGSPTNHRHIQSGKLFQREKSRAAEVGRGFRKNWQEGGKKFANVVFRLTIGDHLSCYKYNDSLIFRFSSPSLTKEQATDGSSVQNLDVKTSRVRAVLIY